MALMMAALGAKAQVTTNVRVGGGYNTGAPCITGLFQANIPFQRGGKLTFSPSVEFDYSTHVDCDGTRNLMLPLQLGYKVPMGNNLLFFPKVGPAVGYDISSGDGFNVGPAAEFAFEGTHFVVAIGGYYSVKDVEYDDYYYDYKTPFNISLTLGYKF